MGEQRAEYAKADHGGEKEGGTRAKVDPSDVFSKVP